MIQQVLPSLSLLLFGFFQFTSWPTLLTIINHYFNMQKEGVITGAWSACGDIGNILGLVLSGIMITSLHLRW
jgi:sugar phosphate permease